METISNFVMVNDQQFKRLFKVEFLDDAVNFLSRIDPRAAKKILYDINKASFTRDPVLLKKVAEEIWEFRTRYSNKHCRLLAFWDKRESCNTLIICSHGIIKKTRKVPEKELIKAKRFRHNYFK